MSNYYRIRCVPHSVTLTDGLNHGEDELVNVCAHRAAIEALAAMAGSSIEVNMSCRLYPRDFQEHSLCELEVRSEYAFDPEGEVSYPPKRFPPAANSPRAVLGIW
jgi:hypothetical protein